MNYDLNFNTSEKLGQDSYKRVYLCNNKNSGQKVVIKVVSKEEFDAEDLPLLFEQIQLFKQLDHPAIVRFYEVYNDVDFIYIVMEYVQGKMLHEYVMNYGACFSERDLCSMIFEIASALKHCHSLGLIHRGLRTQAVRITDNGNVKLLSFGFCVRDAKKKSGAIKLEFSPYHAPELVNGEKDYTNKVDIWSLGVMIHLVTSGMMPAFSLIKMGKYPFEFKEFSDVSREAKDLIIKMIVYHVEDRYDIDQVLKDNWFKKNKTGRHKISS